MRSDILFLITYWDVCIKVMFEMYSAWHHSEGHGHLWPTCDISSTSLVSYYPKFNAQYWHVRLCLSGIWRLTFSNVVIGQCVQVVMMLCDIVFNTMHQKWLHIYSSQTLWCCNYRSATVTNVVDELRYVAINFLQPRRPWAAAQF